MAKMLKRDWEGRYVRLLRQVETRAGDIFEPGEILRVTRNYGGLHLMAVKICRDCKRKSRGYIKGVPERDVILLPADYKPEPEEKGGNQKLARRQNAGVPDS